MTDSADADIPFVEEHPGASALGRGARPYRRFVGIGAGIAVVTALTVTLTAPSDAHRRVATKKPEPVVRIAESTPVTDEPTTEPATTTTAPNPTTTVAAAPETTPPTEPPTVPTTPDTTPASTTTVPTTTTTLPCPDDGAGGAGCPAITPLPIGLISSSEFSCAIANGGQVSCWGGDDRGQLAVPPRNTVNGLMYYYLEPVATPGVTNARAIAVGGIHACALMDGGEVWCWGGDDLGQIGHGDPATEPHGPQHDSSLPVAVPGITNAISVAAGSSHSCAALQTGSVLCWGNDTVGIQSFDPVAVSGINNAIAVSAGGEHTCALLATGRIRCWGDNSVGELGDGTTTTSPDPVDVSGITHAVRVSAGTMATCALLADGHVRCWGYNPYGELGDGTTENSPVPKTVPGIVGARAVVMADQHACAVLADATVRCWGNGSTGQLGDGHWDMSPTPVAVAGLGPVSSIGGNKVTTCARANGKLYCWGWNLFGSIGDGTQNHANRPVGVVGFS